MNSFRWLAALLVVMALSVASCRSGSDFLGKSIPSDLPGQGPSDDSGKQASGTEASSSDQSSDEGTSSSQDQNLSEDQKDELEKVEQVTEVATYDVRNSCKKDSAGVVRVFDEEGKKSVYRPFCDGKGLVSFSCEDNKARASTSNCANGCMLDDNRNAVCRSSPPPQRNPDPRRTSGSTLDRTLGTGN